MDDDQLPKKRDLELAFHVWQVCCLIQRHAFHLTKRQYVNICMSGCFNSFSLQQSKLESFNMYTLTKFHETPHP